MLLQSRFISTGSNNEGQNVRSDLLGGALLLIKKHDGYYTTALQSVYSRINQSTKLNTEKIHSHFPRI